MPVRAKAIGTLTRLISGKRWNALDNSPAFWRAHDRAAKVYEDLIESIDWQRISIEAEGHMWAREDADERTEAGDGIDPKITGLDIKCALLADDTWVDWKEHVEREHRLERSNG